MTQRTLCKVEKREIDYFQSLLFNTCIILIIWNDKWDDFIKNTFAPVLLFNLGCIKI